MEPDALCKVLGLLGCDNEGELWPPDEKGVELERRDYERAENNVRRQETRPPDLEGRACSSTHPQNSSTNRCMSGLNYFMCTHPCSIQGMIRVALFYVPPSTTAKRVMTFGRSRSDGQLLLRQPFWRPRFHGLGRRMAAAVSISMTQFLGGYLVVARRLGF